MDHTQLAVADGSWSYPLVWVAERKGRNLACRSLNAMTAIVVLDADCKRSWWSIGPRWCGLFGSLRVCRLKGQRVLRFNAMYPTRFPCRAVEVFIAETISG